jgi:hypothetical protein
MRTSPDISHESHKWTNYLVGFKARNQLSRQVATLVAFTTTSQLRKQVRDARNEKE